VRQLLVLVTASVALAVGPMASASGQGTRSLPDVLRESMAHYAELASYADTGTVAEETAGMVHESKFRTYFRRATRDLYFDFQQLRTRYPRNNNYVVDMSANRTVIWMFKGEMQTYSFYFKQHSVVPANQQAGTLKGAVAGTTGVSALMPSLLYPKALLPGTLLALEEATPAGVEAIGNRRCHKVTGIAAEYYPSGARVNVRPVTVWIDAESKLVRRVFEDTPEGYGVGVPGAYRRLTVTLDPHANPTIDDAKFAFTVPPGGSIAAKQ
jgi:hypothetical protein